MSEPRYRAAMNARLSERETLDLWCSLPPVPLETMIGRWRGDEVPGTHPMSGLLSVSGWYGKAFLDPDTVHPLLFWNASRTGVFAVHPSRLPMGLPVPVTPLLRLGVVLGRPYLATRRPTARLRMVELYGVTSAAMVYDDRPIVDGFRRLDDDRLMG
ncbi:MAG: GXWXG domain-containing protein, partial [Myxococcota bacterium]